MNTVHFISYEAIPDRVRQGKSLCYVMLHPINGFGLRSKIIPLLRRWYFLMV